MSDSLITPNWPAPIHVKALSTTRLGGVSQAPFDSFNLGLHVGDRALDVLANRCYLQKKGKLPARPKWLDQVHGTQVVDADKLNGPVTADASYSVNTGQVCVVMTADCLPILLCNRKGSFVAAIHAGWRSLLNGIIENTLAKYDHAPKDLIAWLGPCIGSDKFEVGSEVREQFIEKHSLASQAFKPHEGKWLADLSLLATQRLKNLAVTDIHQHRACTYTNAEQFFSYRRDGDTGRMATAIWIYP